MLSHTFGFSLTICLEPWLNEKPSTKHTKTLWLGLIQIIHSFGKISANSPSIPYHAIPGKEDFKVFNGSMKHIIRLAGKQMPSLWNKERTGKCY